MLVVGACIAFPIAQADAPASAFLEDANPTQ
jgi:hypothetical protein